MSAPMEEKESAENIGSLYVGNLTLDVDESQLFQRFSNIGPILSVYLCRDKTTSKSLGYAYVNFHKKEDAERAMHVLNFEEVNGQQIRIMWSQRNSSVRKSPIGNVFIKNLDPQTNDRSLFYIFSPFGKIISSKVAMNDKNESRCFGFVQFEDDESAYKAISKLNGMILNGRNIIVCKFIPKTVRQKEKANCFTNVYVKNLTLDVDTEGLAEMFKDYGTVTSSKVMQDEWENSRCFGFVNYELPEQAAAAVKALNGKCIGGKCLYVSRAEKKTERNQKMKSILNEIYHETNSPKNDVNNFTGLFVQNLPEGFNSDELQQMFESFGHVLSAKVAVDKEGISKRFGFVNFFESQSAFKAMQEINGIVLNGMTLHVSKTLTKNERKLLKSKIEMTPE